MKMRLSSALCVCTGVYLSLSCGILAQEATLLQTSISSQSKDVVPLMRNFIVTVRAIGAEGAVPLSENMQSMPAMPERPVELDPRIEDLREKLSRLPFTSFRLVSSDEEEVTLMNRKTIHLSNGHSLCVRPVERNNDTITMWIKWKDDEGMAILDTRLNFALNESMVAGVEGQEDTGIILAVSVSPRSNEAP